MMGKQLDVQMVGTAFKWSGKAVVSLLRPFEGDTEIEGSGMLQCQAL